LQSGFGYNPPTLNGLPSESLVCCSDSYETVDNATKSGGGAAENRRDKIKLKKSPESPVQSSDYKQDCNNDVDRFHLYFSLFVYDCVICGFI
jgi:hypothetical protein